MKNFKGYVLIMTIVAASAVFSGCAKSDGSSEMDYAENIAKEEGDLTAFRPVDCGLQAQEEYEFPFIGMNVKLSETMLEKIDNREVFASEQADYTESYAISYAVLRFSETTAEEREEECMSVDLFSWEAQLEKIGAIGVYQKECVAQLEELTACDTHEKIGESPDGSYEYYFSMNSEGNEELIKELQESEVLISEMHELDPNLGYTAFSMDRLQGLETVGEFSAQDIFENTYTQEIFKDYDLTLVNVFTTWCSPCVEEIPVLEKIRQEYEKNGKKLGVIAVVLDAKTQNGIDEGALERAQILYERSEADFPFLLPDDSNMNGRLTGIESVPESFFVDKDGKIVSEPYVGANSQEGWMEIIDREFGNLRGNE